MPWTSQHLKWLIDTGETLSTADGKPVKVLKFLYEENEEIMSAWAKHFRNHYCQDSDLDQMRMGTGFSRSEYLINLKFPDITNPLGPSIRAGDFGEILVLDYLEYILGYMVPRIRYSDKTIRNESIKGCDIIGFKIINNNKASNEDTLAIFECKTQFSGQIKNSKLQEAINDSIKDQIRKAESLNALKQKYKKLRLENEAKKVERFQNLVDHPYKEISGAAALFSTSLFDQNSVISTQANHHPNIGNLFIIVIHGKDMMQLVHDLYKRAADEA